MIEGGDDLDRVVNVSTRAYKQWIDVAAAVDGELVRIHGEGRLGVLAGALREELSTVDDVELRTDLEHMLDQEGRPDGPRCEGSGDRDFLVAIGHRVEGVDELVQLGPLLSPGDGMIGQRSTHFIDDDTGTRVLAAMWNRHRPEFDAMYNKRNGLQRMHFYADLAEEVGTTGTVSIPDGRSAGVQQVLDVTGAALVVDWNRFERSYDVVSCHPEIALDVDLRGEYPMLTQFFGTTYRQRGCAPAHELVRRMNELKNPGFDQTRDELDQLLRLDDRQMSDVITACGSYVLPRAVRHWVHCLRRRFDEFDWQPDAKGRFA